MTNITNNLDIVISPVVLSELLEIIDPEELDMDETMGLLVQQIIDNVKNFVERYSHSWFLLQEPVHEFTGLEFRDPDAPADKEIVRYRMTVHGNTVGIFTLDEVPVDEMYDIRQVIADSQFPEYQ